MRIGSGISVNSRQSAWTPGRLSPALWLRADKGITLNGSTVSAWADARRNGLVASQGTAASQPTFVEAAINGRPTVKFTGSHWLVTGTGIVIAGSGRPHTLFAVTLPIANAGVDAAILGYGAAHANTPSVIGAKSPQWSFAGPGSSAPYGGTYVAGTPVALTKTANGTNLTNGWVNDTQVVTNAATGYVIPDTRVIVGAGTVLPVFPANAHVAEAVVFNRIITDAERTLLFRYARSRYGL